jgi:uncharacterized membrane protein
VNRWPVVVLALAFPLLAHASAISGSEALAVASVGCLALAVCWPMHVRPVRLMLALLIVAGLLWALWASGNARVALLFPPMLITGAIGSQFARSLRAGHTPLIERVVVALNPSALSIDGVKSYTRGVTLLWACVLLGLCGLNLLLALFAVPDGLLHAAGLPVPIAVPFSLWSLFANALNYAIILALFVGEYAYRHTRFPQQPYRNFADFLARVARLGPAFWRGS